MERRASQLEGLEEHLALPREWVLALGGVR